MKINLVEVESPMFKSFTMFANPDIKLLKETKTVRVTPFNITKTRISTDIQFGQYCVKINKPIEGFKTHESTEMNYFSGTQSTSYYFVKSKKQNIEAYKEYVKKVVETVIKDYFRLELDEITIELEKGGF
jgi:hypothetical protein